MKTSLQFVPIKDKDLDILVALARQTFMDAYAHKTPAKDMETYCNKAFDRQNLDEEGKNTDAMFFFVKKERQNIGYIKLRWDRTVPELEGETALEIERFYLLKAYYGMGFGKPMLHFCEKFAKMKRMKWLWLLVWPENEQGISFYKKTGFEKFADKIFDFAGHLETDWLFRKLVD